MFEHRRHTTKTAMAFSLAERIFHTTVRNIRESHGHAVIGLILNILQSLLFIIAFFFLFSMFRARPAGIKGDFMLFIMSGVFLFMCHVKAIGAVAGADGATSAIMKHAPMNTVVSISAAALASLYIQILSMVVLLFLYHALWEPIRIHDPVGAMGMILLAWAAGIGIGMVLLAARPWAPTAIGLVGTIIRRANTVASGKMVLANSIGFRGLFIFGWNPLYHTIDQARGYIFEDYSPHFTSMTYPIVFTIVLVVLGMMGEFFTRRFASASWSAAK